MATKQPDVTTEVKTGVATSTKVALGITLATGLGAVAIILTALLIS